MPLNRKHAAIAASRPIPDFPRPLTCTVEDCVRRRAAPAWSPALLVLVAAIGAHADTLYPHTGAVMIEQLDFRGGPWSNVADVTINFDAARGATGYLEGYVNIADVNGQRVVRNKPVLALSAAALPSLTTRLALEVPNGMPVEFTTLAVDYGPLPLFDFTPFEYVDYPVGRAIFAGGGVDDDLLLGYLPPPIWETVNFDPTGPTFVLVQPDHSNVQAATNQCAPAAVANSLDWLDRTQDVPVPHPHRPGLRSDAASGGDDPDDPSLVGELEKAMGRNVNSRTDGRGVWPLDGKLKYVADNDLDDDLVIKHRGGGRTGGSPNDELDGESDLTRHGVKSHGTGAKVTWEWIFNELANGEDVEIDIHFSGGGRHYVRVIGAGKILGKPFIVHVSDHAQSDQDQDDPNTPDVDETDTRGTDKTDFGYLDEDDLTHPDLPTWNGEIDQAISESKVVKGDLNCDGVVDFGDINPFVLLLSNPAAWEATFPDCNPLAGDVNGDGVVDFGDINPFVALLTGN